MSSTLGAMVGSHEAMGGAGDVLAADTKRNGLAASTASLGSRMQMCDAQLSPKFTLNMNYGR